MEEYLANRRELIAEDRAARLDVGKQNSVLSVQADALVREIRADEAVTVWSADSKETGGDDNTHLYPGMAFLTGTCSSGVM